MNTTRYGGIVSCLTALHDLPNVGAAVGYTVGAAVGYNVGKLGAAVGSSVLAFHASPFQSHLL